MKKIITLLFSVGAFATSFAQNGSHQQGNDKNVGTETKRNDQYGITKSNADHGKFDNHRDNIYAFSARERDQQIDMINHDFNYKIKSIQNSRNIRHREKKAMIQKAQLERAQQIQMVNSKFNSKYNSTYNVHEKKYENHKH